MPRSLEPVAGHLLNGLMSVVVTVPGPVVDVVQVEGRHGHVRVADLQVGVHGVEGGCHQAGADSGHGAGG